MILLRYIKIHATPAPSPLPDRWAPVICTRFHPPLVGIGSSKGVTGSFFNCLQSKSHVFSSKTKSRGTRLLVKNQSQSSMFGIQLPCIFPYVRTSLYSTRLPALVGLQILNRVADSPFISEIKNPELPQGRRIKLGRISPKSCASD